MPASAQMPTTAATSAVDLGPDDELGAAVIEPALLDQIGLHGRGLVGPALGPDRLLDVAQGLAGGWFGRSVHGALLIALRGRACCPLT